MKHEIHLLGVKPYHQRVYERAKECEFGAAVYLPFEECPKTKQKSSEIPEQTRLTPTMFSELEKKTQCLYTILRQSKRSKESAELPNLKVLILFTLMHLQH